MHLALHAAQNGPADVKAVADLERALDRLPASLWDEGFALARSLKSLDAFAAGLHVTSRGSALATRWHLPMPGSIELLLRTSAAPAEALQIHRLTEASGLAARVRFVGRKVWPTASYMIGREPHAGTGPSALLTARLRRMTGLPRKFGVALRSWYAARSRARRLRTVTANGWEFKQ
jgi:hypothetical protein